MKCKWAFYRERQKHIVCFVKQEPRHAVEPIPLPRQHDMARGFRVPKRECRVPTPIRSSPSAAATCCSAPSQVGMHAGCSNYIKFDYVLTHGNQGFRLINFDSLYREPLKNLPRFCEYDVKQLRFPVCNHIYRTWEGFLEVPDFLPKTHCAKASRGQAH